METWAGRVADILVGLVEQRSAADELALVADVGSGARGTGGQALVVVEEAVVAVGGQHALVEGVGDVVGAAQGAEGGGEAGLAVGGAGVAHPGLQVGHEARRTSVHAGVALLELRSLAEGGRGLHATSEAIVSEPCGAAGDAAGIVVDPVCTNADADALSIFVLTVVAVGFGHTSPLGADVGVASRTTQTSVGGANAGSAGEGAVEADPVGGVGASGAVGHAVVVEQEAEPADAVAVGVQDGGSGAGLLAHASDGSQGRVEAG